MALAGAASIGLEAPRADKRLLVIAETDGCFLDGLAVAAGVEPGRRTLRVEDYGKVAATFVDVKTGEAIRLAPRLDVRSAALAYARGENCHYFAQLAGYQVMPDQKLFSAMPVVLGKSIEELISRPGIRTNCTVCGEEIINQREVVVDGQPLCVSCAHGGYYAAAVSLPLKQMESANSLDAAIHG
jgi:formylmethanofuran dehydrogenase subunit E